VKAGFQAGVARRVITPTMKVELAGLGYYLERYWERVRDDLNATALVVTGSNNKSVAIVAMDLMYNDAAFTASIRQQAAAQTGLVPESICVNCSHTHNAPTAGFIRGAGEQNPEYMQFAAKQAVDAVVEAWNNRKAARISVGQTEIVGLTFNRTRESGPVDTRLSVLKIESPKEEPIAAVINFHSHCTAHMEVDLRAISRDWPGEVVDRFAKAFTGVTALYVQGTAGDVNTLRKFNSTELRFEPAKQITAAAFEAWLTAKPVKNTTVDYVTVDAKLPTRAWTRTEVMSVRDESLHRQNTGDTRDWTKGFARAAVGQPERLPLRYGGSEAKAVAALARFGLEWSEEAVPLIDEPAKPVRAEVQALRIGDVFFAAHPSELFTKFGLDLRERFNSDNLFVLGYSNGSIGYVPDEYEIERGGYAALQSPKFTGQLPFTPKAGDVLVETMLNALNSLISG
jgi:neutral ceramidase